MGIKQAIEWAWGDRIGQKDALSEGAAGMLQFPNQAIFPSNNFADLVKGGYQKNAVVFACIQSKVKALNASRFQIVDIASGEAIGDHPVRVLIHNPNPFTSEYSFWEQVLLSLDLAGIAYIHKVRNAEGGLVEMLWNLRPDSIKPVTDATSFIKHYVQEIGGSSRTISIDDLIVIKYTNPDNPFAGQPPLNAALRDTATDNEATDFKKVMLQNKGMSPGIIISTKSKMTNEMRDRFVADWAQRFGSENRGRPVITEMNAMDIKSLALNMNELAIRDLTDISEARICAVLGVPPIIVGVNVGLSNATYSNAAEFRKSFYEDTIIPLQNLIDDSLDADLIQEADSTVRGEFNNSNVPALAGIRQAKFDQADKAVVNGWWTINEARIEVGKMAIDGGDIFRQPSNPSDAGSAEKSQMEAQFKLSAGTEGIGLLDEAIGRRNSAEKHLKKLRAWVVKVFQRERDDVMAMMKRTIGLKQLSPGDVDALDTELAKLAALWTAATVDEGGLILGTILNEASESAAAHLGIAFDLSTEFQQAFVSEYGFKFADRISKTSVEDIRKIIFKSQQEGWSQPKMKKALMAKFTDWTSSRATMVARTETIRANNHGAENVWKTEGIGEKEWLPAGDPCDWCETMRGKRMQVGSNFFDQGQNLTIAGKTEGSPARVMNFSYEDVLAPPLHPNCRCALIPVIED